MQFPKVSPKRATSGETQRISENSKRNIGRVETESGATLAKQLNYNLSFCACRLGLQGGSAAQSALGWYRPSVRVPGTFAAEPYSGVRAVNLLLVQFSSVRKGRWAHWRGYNRATFSCAS